jgi:hypothetical protein
MRHFAIVLLAVAGSLPSLAAAEATKILQQRTPDGSILLTDQPSPGAKTERSWHVNVSDRAAERQRAIDVKAEANLVSERIQRSIDSQRRADDEAQRTRLAYAQLERDRMAALSTQDGISYGYAGGVGWATPFRASRQPGLRVGDTGVMDPTGTRGEGRHNGRGGHGGHDKPSEPKSRGSRSR